MKKFISVLLAAMLCIFVSALSVSAQNDDKVIDNAGLVSDSEESQLESLIADVIEKYDFGYDIVIVTVNSTDGKSPEAYADDYYDYNNYGYDSAGSGLLLLVDMGNRKWHISTKGSGINAFTDYGIKRIGENVVDGLQSENYYGTFSDFVDLADEYIEAYENGEAIDVGNAPKNYAVLFLVSAGLGLILALIICLSLHFKLRTAVKQHSAQAYIKNGSSKITKSRDVFLYKTLSRVKVESDSGGSSTHRSSSGSTHGGGGGSF